MVILLLSGKAGSGKDTVADILVKKYKFKKLAFADQLKKIYINVFGMTNDELIKYKNFFRTNWKLDDLKELDEKLYEKVKSKIDLEKEEYLGLIEYGKYLREMFGKDYFVDYLHEDFKHLFTDGKHRVVISDWRYENELAFFNRLVKTHQKIKVRIDTSKETLNKRGYKVLNDQSEKELDNVAFNLTLENNSTMNDLEKEVENLVRKIGG